MNANTKNSQIKHCPCPKFVVIKLKKKIKLLQHILNMDNVLFESFLVLAFLKVQLVKFTEQKKHLENLKYAIIKHLQYQ